MSTNIPTGSAKKNTSSRHSRESVVKALVLVILVQGIYLLILNYMQIQAAASLKSLSELDTGISSYNQSWLTYSTVPIIVYIISSMIVFIYIWHRQSIEKEISKENGRTSATLDPKQAYLIELRNILIKRFNEGELRTLSMDIGVDYENLPDKGKDNKARELVCFLDRRNQVLELIEIGRQQRPDINWPEEPK